MGGDINDPFKVFPEVSELYANRLKELRDIVAKRHEEEQKWAEANPEKAKLYKEWFSGKAPKIDWTAVSQKADVCNTCSKCYLLKRTC